MTYFLLFFWIQVCKLCQESINSTGADTRFNNTTFVYNENFKILSNTQIYSNLLPKMKSMIFASFALLSLVVFVTGFPQQQQQQQQQQSTDNYYTGKSVKWYYWHWYWLPCYFLCLGQPCSNFINEVCPEGFQCETVPAGRQCHAKYCADGACPSSTRCQNLTDVRLCLIPPCPQFDCVRAWMTNDI